MVFEPREQGVVTEFTITKVTRRQDASREVKDVTVTAPVRALTGETVQKTLILTLERLDGRWMVIQIR